MTTAERGVEGDPARILAVVDWTVDPRRVVDALSREAGQSDAVAIDLLVPSRLPGLDWVGDPGASRPCAEHQLVALWRLATAAGLRVDRGGVGSPERVSAVRSWVETWGADRILLFDRERRLPRHPLSAETRLARSPAVPVIRLAVAPTPALSRRFPHRAPRCAALTTRS
jgi:hypothetical protein